MPKKVDHHARRVAIAQSVWDLMARSGIQGVTMRNVAAHARMSLGQLQHYFPTKDALLTCAYELVTEQVANRVSTREDPVVDEDPTPRDVVRNALIEMLPLDEERADDARVWVTYLARSSAKYDAAHLVRKTHTELMDFIVDQLRRGQRAGAVPVHLKPCREARTLLALLDGLTIHVLIGLHLRVDAEQALDTHLDHLFSD
jgi:TetR/AcrR family transcriptional repressor of bet genes